jgi:YVTN family beta-propeller protein
VAIAAHRRCWSAKSASRGGCPGSGSSSLYSNTVSVIDTASNAVTATIHVGVTPFGVAITPDGRYAYITNQNSGTVLVIDPGTG